MKKLSPSSYLFSIYKHCFSLQEPATSLKAVAMPKASVLTIFLLLPGFCIGQVTLFDDNFGSYSDGTTAGPDWYIDATDCDDASPNEGLGISTFAVWGGKFTVNDSEGAPCCPAGGGGYQNYLYTQDIHIDTICSAFYTFGYTRSLNQECELGTNPFPLDGCAGTSPPDDVHDQIYIEMQLDGGPWILKGGGCGPGAGSVLGGPIALNNNSIIRFRISAANNADDEYIYIDFLTVTGTAKVRPIFDDIGPFCENDPIFLLPTTSLNNISGNWSVGPYFNPSGQGGNTVPIIFTPAPTEVCAAIDTLYIDVHPSENPNPSPIGPFCTADPTVVLQNNIDGIPGTWSGPGVNSGSFSPEDAGNGNHILTYTPSTQCSDIATIMVSVTQTTTPNLETATICSAGPNLDLLGLQDPSFPNGNWSGPGVSGSSFNPTGQSGIAILTYTPNGTCTQTATTAITIDAVSEPLLGNASICSADNPLFLLDLNDPLFYDGTWSGLGVSGDFFDPAGLSGDILLSFSPTGYCVNTGTTTIALTPAETPSLGTVNLCTGDPPFSLTTLADPDFPIGTWSGPGVTGNSFNPTGQNGAVTLNFTPAPLGDCVDASTTTITVNPLATIQLGTASLCENDDPLSLSTLADPDFPSGTWSGPGVSGNIFDPNGQNGAITLIFTPAANCAQATTTTLTVNALPTLNVQSITGCDPSGQTYTVTLNISGGSSPYSIDGNPLSGNNFTSAPIPTGTDYSFALSDAEGCGTVPVTGLVNCICTSTSSNIVQVLCPGETLVVNGETFGETNPSGTILLPGANFNGCDSIVNISLGFSAPAVGNLSQTLCPGQSLNVNGILYDLANPSGTQSFPNSSHLGCDSTLFVTLAFSSVDTTTLFASTCIPSGVGVFVQNMVNQSGCDSIVVTTVTYSLVDTTLMATTTCDPSLAGIFTQNYTTAEGCDSTVITTIAFVPGGDTTVIFTNSCDPSSVGVFIQNLTGQQGCDSTVVTAVSLANTDTTLLFGTSCNPASVGVFYQNLVNAVGCDSTVVTTVAYSLVDTTMMTTTTCDPALTGVFTQNYITAEGCDSLTVTTVLLSPTDTVYFTQNTCDPSQAGVFTQTYTNQYGCDSVVVATVGYAQIDTVFATNSTCDPAMVGVFVQTLVSGQGCDSTVVTLVGLLPSSTTSINSTSCDPSLAGVFTQVFSNQHGCDSTVTTTVLLLPTDTALVLLETCDPSQVGTVTSILQNQYGCDSVVVAVTSLLPPAACSVEFSVESSPVPCVGTGGTLSLTATVGEPPFGYEIWQNGSVVAAGAINAIGQTTIVDNLPAGDYQTILTSAAGNVETVNISIGQVPTPQITVAATAVFANNGVSCEGASDGSALATGSGGTVPYSFLWSNAAIGSEATGLGAGVYTVTILDANGCSAVDSVEIQSPAKLETMLSVNDPDCFDASVGMIAVDASGGTIPYTYSLDGGSFQASNLFSGLSSNLYEITVQDANGCEAKAIILLNAPVPIDVELGDDVLIELGSAATLDALVNVPFDSLATVTWSNLGDIDCPNCLQQAVFPILTTNYSVKIIGENGCADQDDMTVFVDRRRHVYAPNAFSPNDDGINDLFTIYPKPGSVAKVRSFLVLSRWGETVHRYSNFQPGDPASGWDGTHRGQPLDPAVFTWFAEIEFSDGEVELVKGDVTLIR